MLTIVYKLMAMFLFTRLSLVNKDLIIPPTNWNYIREIHSRKHLPSLDDDRESNQAQDPNTFDFVT